MKAQGQTSPLRVLVHLYQCYKGESKLSGWFINRKQHGQYTVTNRVQKKKITTPLLKGSGTYGSEKFIYSLQNIALGNDYVHPQSMQSICYLFSFTLSIHELPLLFMEAT